MVLHIDNNGEMFIGSAQHPTRQTKHIDIKKFALLDWVERDLLIMKCISTTDNDADGMTKSLGFFSLRHFDYIMGYNIPSYANKINIKGTTTRHIHIHSLSDRACNGHT